jgi:hypothetical protein
MAMTRRPSTDVSRRLATAIMAVGLCVSVTACGRSKGNADTKSVRPTAQNHLTTLTSVVSEPPAAGAVLERSLRNDHCSADADPPFVSREYRYSGSRQAAIDHYASVLERNGWQQSRNSNQPDGDTVANFKRSYGEWQALVIVSVNDSRVVVTGRDARDFQC